MACDISVIVCAYTEDRWNDLVAAVVSVKEQTLSPAEIIIVIDHNPALLKRAKRHLPDTVVVENTEARGASGSRNTGIAVDELKEKKGRHVPMEQFHYQRGELLIKGLTLWQTVSPIHFLSHPAPIELLL